MEKILPTAKLVYPHQMAWLRRPEKDEGGYEVWEMPDGVLFFHDPKEGSLRLMISEEPDEKDKSKKV